jgi:hypothetical protein
MANSETVAKNPSALTEWARGLLRAEMMKRGLEWKEQPVPESKAPVEMPDDDHLLVLLREYEDIGKAAEDRHALREASVKAYFL